jgi:tetratricopeptide (TPR) repeat protein
MAAGWRRGLVAACLAIGLAVPVRAADHWPVPRGPSREPAPYQYQPARWKQVPRAFLEDAPACTLYCGNTYLIEEDGTVENVVHEITRLNSRKAIEKLGEYRHIYYDPAFETLTLNEARVLKAGGRAVPIEPRHLQLRDVSTDYQVYDHGKQLVISFPNLEVGDCIEVKWATRGKNPEHHGQFFTRYTFGDDDYPIVLDELRVRLPRDRALRYSSIGGQLEPAVTEDETSRLLHWQVSHRPGLPRDEHLPPREELRLQVAVSTFTSWSHVGHWKQRLRAECWKCTPAVRQVVQQVTRGLTRPEDRARALTYWVRRNIRYVSTGRQHDYTPHPPQMVLENRYGDCKDTTQLLAVMLKEAGVPVALATIGLRGDGQVLPEVPSPWGTHALLLLSLDGHDHWIDTTASLAGWDFLPMECRDRLAYVVDDNGLRLVRTPSSNPQANRIEQASVVSVGPDGSSRIERTLTASGAAAVARRDQWLEVPSGERSRQLGAELHAAFGRARLRRLAIDEKQLRDFDQPVTAQIVFEVPNHFSGDGVREGSIFDSTIWKQLLSYDLGFDRQAPLLLGTPFESLHRWTVRLPAAYVFAGFPSDKLVRSKWGSFRLTVWADVTEPRQIELEFHTRLEQVTVAPGDFDAFRKFHDAVQKHYRTWLAIEPVRSLGEAPLLEAVLMLTPGDTATSAILARLYLENGESAEARRLLRQARASRPTDPQLLELAVKAADTLAEEERLYRELIRLFPGDPKYLVALGRTLIDRNQHAAARTVLQPVATKGPSSWRAAAELQLARSFLLDSRPELALEHLQAASHADPARTATRDGLELLGKVYEDLRRPGDAITAYRAALVRAPDEPRLLGALVRLELSADNHAEALEHLRRYAANATSAADLAQAAHWYFRLDRLEEAFDLASRSASRSSSPLAHRTLGLVQLRRGDWKKAAFHLERGGESADVQAGLIQAYLTLGELRKAEKLAERAAKNATGELDQACLVVQSLARRRAVLSQEVKVPAEASEAWAAALDGCVCAEHACTAGRMAEAEALLTAVFQRAVELGPAYGLRGWLAVERGRLAQAAADADRAIRLSPREPRGWLVRGRVRFERGQNTALADLLRAAELSQRNDPVSLHWLAAAQFRAKAYEEALRTQHEAVRLRPDDAELRQQLQTIENAVKSGNDGR